MSDLRSAPVGRGRLPAFGRLPKSEDQMRIRTWNPAMSLEETKELAYWERNVLALHFADGWYEDTVWSDDAAHPNGHLVPRYDGWRRVLSLEGGKITFHIPDDLDVGTLPEIKPNWDGHTTEEKWLRILREKGICAIYGQDETPK